MNERPDFHELVGDEGTPEDLAGLRRAHELLVAAGPPPELSPGLARPPAPEAIDDDSKGVAFRRRRPFTALGIAAALAVGAFFVGFVVGDHRNGFSTARTLAMHGVGRLASARAELKVGSSDAGGNYPLEMTVSGLQPTPKGYWYELLLSKKGKPTLSCGSFRVDGASVTLRMSVPYDLSEFPKLFDGWVVTLHRPGNMSHPLGSRIVMTT